MVPTLSTRKRTHAKQYLPLLHFRRAELKYVVPDRLIPSLIDRISLYTQPDPYLVQEGKSRSSYPVTSLYFDSLWNWDIRVGWCTSLSTADHRWYCMLDFGFCELFCVFRISASTGRSCSITFIHNSRTRPQEPIQCLKN